MTDYLPLLSRAVASLERNTDEGRRAVYDRARAALVNQLRAMNPPLAEAEITRERLALEEAIRRVEMQSRAEAKAAAPPPRPVAPPAPRPAAAAQTRVREPVGAGAEAPDSVAEAEVPIAPAVEPVRPKADGRTPMPDVFRLDEIADAKTAEGAAGRSAEGGGPVREPLKPRSPQARTVDFAKADAQKALEAKLLVSGIIVALFAIALLIGYVHRERILASIGLASAPSRQVADAGKAKGGDRVPTAAAETRAPSASPTTPVAAVAQRAVLYEENPGAGNEQLQTFVGTAVWNTETVNLGPGRPPELGLRVDVEVPDRRMTVRMTIRRNPDQALPASHTVEVQFNTPGDPFGGVANLPGIRAKTTETAQGAPLVGLVVRVMPGFFLIGLSAIDADREQNLSLLRERGWIDVPFVYNNGRRAVLVIEKGTPGERAVNEAVMAWGG